ncbi:MAG TPA: CoA transferase [Chloroflexota bacterium]|jgi:crotonobetainyl-CoA:carnitine CoA-transferase CaiB-like acyl-CoA transferase|nr:CoA transferase [Chloroflexota bacterium]
MTGPLSGIRVVDLTRALAGPYCTLLLGDMGADVIKIELPGTGDETRQWGPPFINGESSYFLSVNRNKRSVTLDLKSQTGLEALTRLILAADVLVENFRPGTMERLGLGYDKARELNPSLVFCAVSGFGQTGPRARQPAYDAILQGMGGVQFLSGEQDGGPTRVGVPIADITAGMFAAFAVASALYWRDRDPARRGQFIDASMLGGQVGLLTYQAGRYFATGSAPTRIGNRHASIAPYEMFKASDGYINVAAANEPMWQRFLNALDLTALASDARFATNADRVTNRDSLSALIEDRLARLTMAEVISRLEAAEVPVGPVYDLAQVFADPQSQHLQMALPTPHPKVPDLQTTGFPFRLSETSPEVRCPPPLLGEHTAEVLREVGYSDEEIAALGAS